MNVIIDWKNLRRLYDEINCRCKLNIFQGARVKSLCQMFAASFYGITENKKSANEHLIQTVTQTILKGYLFFQVPQCIIYLESESDMTPICPQWKLKGQHPDFRRLGCYFFLITHEQYNIIGTYVQAKKQLTQTNSFGRISIRKVFYDHGAVIAQVVERRLGKAEVTGSSPVNSFYRNQKVLCKTGRSYFFAIKLLAYQKQPKWALYHKSVAC